MFEGRVSVVVAVVVVDVVVAGSVALHWDGGAWDKNSTIMIKNLHHRWIRIAGVILWP